ncbi:MAG: type I-U CRISPR-associated protein Cas7 [Phycisphaerae bacterium]|nr:type I-U CRISPR-associated protein Cas7 [Phycisphaerae bacterium]
MECELKPLQGDRFQPTGFADLGPARYTRPDDIEMLLVESAQSVANRLEMAIWDDAEDDLIPELKGLPYILVKRDGKPLTNSILEAHRINSPYILEGTDKSVFDQLKKDAAGLETGPVRLRDLAKIVFKYDPNAVLHGVFLAKSELAGGRLRMSRLISGFIEAQGASPAESGGVKNDRVDPSGDTAKGFGNVPFHRSEFVAASTKAYFNLDLALLRGYGLPEDANRLLIALALFKIQKFLRTGLRLRTACDLEPAGEGLKVTRPNAFTIPSEATLLSECNALVGKCKAHFAHPAVTVVDWKQPPKKKGKKDGEESSPDEEQE